MIHLILITHSPGQIVFTPPTGSVRGTYSGLEMIYRRSSPRLAIYFRLTALARLSSELPQTLFLYRFNESILNVYCFRFQYYPTSSTTLLSILI